MNRLKELRLKNKLSQTDIAKLLGVTRQAVSLYEQGKRQLNKSDINTLTKYFNVSVPYLQGKILFVDLSEDEQKIFNDVLDVLITTTDNKAIHVLEALLNSFKECYFEENTRIAPEKK